MSEAAMRRYIVRCLSTVHGNAVENKIGAGTPDVCYAGGWVELKKLKQWPKFAESKPVTIRHFVAAQRKWLSKHCRAKGKAFLLLQVKKEWLLFWGTTASAHVGKVDKNRLIEIAHAYWPNGLNEKEFIECLTK